MSNQTIPSPDEIASLGEKIYFEKKDEFEKKHFGKFVVIEIDSGDCFIDQDKLIAIQEARSKYPDKLFYIAQIGNLKQPSIQEAIEVKKNGWSF